MKDVTASEETLVEMIGEVRDAVEELQDTVSDIQDSVEAKPKDGKDGIDGKDGKDGADGKDGKPGSKGPKGDKGEKGDKGDPGKDGVSIKMEDLLKEAEPLIVSAVPRHSGGNMNRNIAIGGNLKALNRYTDINFKAGSNVTITYANNDSTKNTDITFAASGSGGGITRQVNAVNTSLTADSTASTDQVYVCSDGIAVTLPTAVGNSNLYTIKNTAASSVLVATTGGESIDGDTELILATQFTSVDLISDGTNWKIT